MGSDAMTQIDNEAARESVLEIQVTASLHGHDLGPFEPLEDRSGWQATCRQCGGTAYVRQDGLQYSLLGDVCDKNATTGQ